MTVVFKGELRDLKVKKEKPDMEKQARWEQKSQQQMAAVTEMKQQQSVEMQATWAVTQQQQEQSGCRQCCLSYREKLKQPILNNQ